MKKYFCFIVLVLMVGASLGMDLYRFFRPQVEVYEILMPMIISDEPVMDEKNRDEYIIPEEEIKEYSEEVREENNNTQQISESNVNVTESIIVEEKISPMEKETRQIETIVNQPVENKTVVNEVTDEIVVEEIANKNNNPILYRERPVVEDNVIVNKETKDMSGGKTVTINKVERVWPEYDNISGTTGQCEYCGGSGVIDGDLRQWSDVNGVDHITHNSGCTEAFKSSIVESESELNCR